MGRSHRSPFTREADSSLFTNPLPCSQQTQAEQFHAAIPRLLRLVAVDPLDSSTCTGMATLRLGSLLAPQLRARSTHKTAPEQAVKQTQAQAVKWTRA
eukprot:gene1180-32518_t